MPGVFDFLNDPSQAGTNALMFGLLGGRGNLSQVLGQAGMSALQANAQAQESQTKQMLQKAQIADMAQQEELRRQQAKRLADSQAQLAQILSNPGSQNQYGTAGTGMSVAGVKEPMTPQAGGLAGATAEQIAALKANGTDLSNLWELAQFGKEMQPGYRRNVGGSVSYFGDPTKGIDYNPTTKQVSLLPGATDTQSALAGATTGAQESARAPFTLTKFTGPRGEERQTTLDQFKRMLAMQAVQGDMQQTNTPKANYDIGGVKGSINADGSTGAGIQAGQTPLQAAQSAAMKTQEEAKAKSTGELRDEVVKAGFTADNKIAKLNQIGKLLDGVEGNKLSGIGVTAAQFANSFGIKLDPKLSDKEAATALTKELALQIVRGGGADKLLPGSMSDRDVAFSQSITPDMATSAEGRKTIINTRIALEQRNKDVAGAVRKWENKYGQLNNDFFDQLQQWSNDHQMFK